MNALRLSMRMGKIGFLPPSGRMRQLAAAFFIAITMTLVTAGMVMAAEPPGAGALPVPVPRTRIAARPNPPFSAGRHDAP